MACAEGLGGQSVGPSVHLGLAAIPLCLGILVLGSLPPQGDIQPPLQPGCSHGPGSAQQVFPHKMQIYSEACAEAGAARPCLAEMPTDWSPFQRGAVGGAQG